MISNSKRYAVYCNAHMSCFITEMAFSAAWFPFEQLLPFFFLPCGFRTRIQCIDLEKSAKGVLCEGNCVL